MRVLRKISNPDLGLAILGVFYPRALCNTERTDLPVCRCVRGRAVHHTKHSVAHTTTCDRSGARLDGLFCFCGASVTVARLAHAHTDLVRLGGPTMCVGFLAMRAMR